MGWYGTLHAYGIDIISDYAYKYWPPLAARQSRPAFAIPGGPTKLKWQDACSTTQKRNAACRHRWGHRAEQATSEETHDDVQYSHECEVNKRLRDGA
eukprot:1160106-Pelagomonas_calceolata.AAC.7